jgi:hypothetical protein
MKNLKGKNCLFGFWDVAEVELQLKVRQIVRSHFFAY